MVPASLVSCYNSQELDCYKAVTPATAYSQSANFCSKNRFINGFKDWPGIQYALNDLFGSISYNWKITWKPNCADGQLTFNVGQPIIGFSCEDAMRLAFDGCNDGGHGGTVEVGCLVYHFNPVNQDDGICSLPFV
ncbi:hypothetical protein GGR54DRAFT_589825 [Hypoxylon sp. NC1633]|nr:hypothetical protein GGR54DRAFT_589825 [Hypoxylon sp. NC1633]